MGLPLLPGQALDAAAHVRGRQHPGGQPPFFMAAYKPWASAMAYNTYARCQSPHSQSKSAMRVAVAPCPASRRLLRQ